MCARVHYYYNNILYRVKHTHGIGRWDAVDLCDISLNLVHFPWGFSRSATVAIHSTVYGIYCVLYTAQRKMYTDAIIHTRKLHGVTSLFYRAPLGHPSHRGPGNKYLCHCFIIIIYLFLLGSSTRVWRYRYPLLFSPRVR